MPSVHVSCFVSGLSSDMRERERERHTHTHTKGVLWVPCFLEELKDAHWLGCWVVVWTLDSELERILFFFLSRDDLFGSG
jgi:hypothetical protein